MVRYFVVLAVLLFGGFFDTPSDEPLPERIYIPLITNITKFNDPSLAHYLGEFSKKHGSAVHTSVIDVPVAWEHFTGEFNIGTPENDLKMYITQPQPGVWDFSSGDYVVNTLVDAGIKPWGHTLFWWTGNSEWLENVPDNQIEVLAHERIDTLITHYGVIKDWDLGNELFDENGKNRKTEWEFSSDYVDRLFEYAHEKYPDKHFWYNDLFGQYGFGAGWKARIIRLAESGNLYGVGFQLHLNAFADNTLALEEIRDFSERLGTYGVHVRISELDGQVRSDCSSDCLFGTTIPEKDYVLQQKMFYDIMCMCVELWNCTDITWWGINDTYNWRSSDQYPDIGHASDWWGNYFPDEYVPYSSKDSYYMLISRLELALTGLPCY